jgi:hypothetical protein
LPIAACEGFASHFRKADQSLRYAVLENLEVVTGQTSNRLSGPIADDHIDNHTGGGRPENRDLLSGGILRLLSWRRVGRQAEYRSTKRRENVSPGSSAQTPTRLFSKQG